MIDCPIYCINLEHREDRKQHSLKEFTKLGIQDNQVTYPKIVKDTRGGVYGCYDSHMKCWYDFITKYPKKKYALVFEDDFVITDNTKSVIKKAVKFLEKNYDNIDILFLHDSAIPMENTINNTTFTNGYGLTTTTLFVTRHYIEAIISKYGTLPEPTGLHFDFELSINMFDKDNRIFSEKCFFTKKVCIKQLVDQTDNNLGVLDSIFRKDINQQVNDLKKVLLFIKKNKICNDIQIRNLSKFLYPLITL
jgi:GR25 family glycosyltransferase involved in LPS biosynthesis